MLRATDRQICHGLYVSPTYYYVQSNMKNSVDKQIARNTELFEFLFSKIRSFCKKNLPNLPNFDTRLADLKKTGAKSEYYPNAKVVTLEPQQDFKQMLKSYFMQLIFIDQIETGKLVTLSSNAYQWKNGSQVSEVRMPTTFLTVSELPHLVDAEKRSSVLVEKFLQESFSTDAKNTKKPNYEEIYNHMVN